MAGRALAEIPIVPVRKAFAAGQSAVPCAIFVSQPAAPSSLTEPAVIVFILLTLCASRAAAVRMHTACTSWPSVSGPLAPVSYIRTCSLPAGA